MDAFIKNFIKSFLNKFFILFLSLIASVIVARALGPEGKGVFTIAISFSAFIIVLANLGMTDPICYYTSRDEFPKKIMFGNSVLFSLIAGFVSVVLGLVFILLFSGAFFPGIESEYLVFSLCFMPFLLLIPNLNSILLGKKDISTYNLSLLLQGILYLSFISFLLLYKISVFSALAGSAISFFVTSSALFMILLKGSGGIDIKPDINYFRKCLPFGIKSHISSILAFFVLRFPMFMVNYYLGTLSTGIFSVSLVLAQQVELLPYTMSLMLFPSISGEKDEERRRELTPFVFRTVLFLLSICIIFLMVVSKPLISLLYSDRFLDSIFPFQILLPGILFVSIWRVFTTDFSARGKPEYTLFINIVMAFLCLLLNSILIPWLGIIGASLAFSTSFCISGVLSLVLYKKITKLTFRELFFPNRLDRSVCEDLVNRYVLRKKSPYNSI